ncbi:GDP-mannose 4,6-dehydratase [Candidatus Pelagibacter sp.]|nr:GDP-mannose 4,6-dehydratase [Candidatus Pelagibacter sp.]
MKNIIITGALGQDGILLSKILVKNKFKVFGVVTNSIKKTKKIKNVKYFKVSNKKFHSVQNLLDNIKPDVIVHLGSNNPSFKQKFKKIDYKRNSEFTKKLINYSIEYKKTKFIFPSSSQIFKYSKKKINEKSVYKVSSYYTKFRINLTNHLLKIKKKYNLNASVVILFNHDSIYRNPRFLLPRLIKAIRQKNYNFLKKIYYANISGDFSHAEDICNGIYKLIKKDCNPDKIILSSGKKTYINTIIEYFIPKFKSKIDVEKINFSKSSIGNNLKAIKILNWKIKKSFLDAAKELYKSKN